MTHILIVDDEGLEQEAMQKLIMKAFPKVQVIGKAGNGREAIQYVLKSSPDLILMDIKMPGIDGLEAIKEIKKINDRIRFIMVTAFNTFAYAQKAIREGVKDYLVKPSKKEEIIQTLSKVLHEIEDEKDEKEANNLVKAKYNRALDHIQSDWVANLLFNYIHHESIILESFSFDRFQYFSALALQLNIQNHNQWSIDQQTTLYKELESLIKSVSSGIVGPMMSFQIPVLLAFNEDKEKKSIHAKATTVARKLLKKIAKNYPELDCRIGIGEYISNIHHFSESYHKANLALEETTSKVKFLYYHPSIVRDSVETQLDEAEKNMIDAIRYGNIETFEDIYLRFFKELTLFYNQDLIKIIHHLDELRIVLNRFLKEWKIEFILPELTFQADSLIQLREQAKSRLLTSIHQIYTWQTENIQGVMYKAREWIDTHFTEDISLDEVAAYVQLSPYYFSKLFKERMDGTFIDYLTQKRIERAKSLLTKTKLSLKEICFNVGYRDPNYFSRVFKKITGKTPSTYRKQLSS